MGLAHQMSSVFPNISKFHQPDAPTKMFFCVFKKDYKIWFKKVISN